MASDVEAKQLAQANSFADLHFYCSSDEEDNDSDEEDTQIPSKLMHEERQKEIEAWNAKEGNTQRHVLTIHGKSQLSLDEEDIGSQKQGKLKEKCWNWLEEKD